MSTEKAIRIDIHHPIHYNWSGLFIAPDDRWSHMHRRLADFELMAVQHGTLYVADDQGTYEVQEGEYLLMPPTQHQYGWKESDCSFHWMHFMPTEPEQYEELVNPKEGLPYESGYVILPLQGRLTSGDRVHTLLQQLSDTERRYMDPEENMFLATGVLCEIQNQIRHTSDFHGGKDNFLLEQIEEYISGHIGDRLQVKDIAEHFGYNEKYLTTIFREKTNTSLKQHIISAKMERARFLLCNTNASVTEIAWYLNYWNEQSFATAFKKCMGMTPSEFRRMYSAGLVNRV